MHPGEAHPGVTRRPPTPYPLCMVRRIAGTLFALALAAAPARAQVVRGVVTEDGTSAPVNGAMVIVMELDGTLARRVLTDETGAFIARVDHPGRYVIRVDRIGYESTTTDGFDVPVDGTFQRVTVPIHPVELMGLDVSGSRRCEVRPEEGRATARAWDEARKALEAAAWTISSGAYRYTLLQFTRTYDEHGVKVLNERRRFVRGTGQAPYVSLPGKDLVDDGFIRTNEDRTLTYYAPDAEAFLSDAFLDTHCMHVDEIKDGMVGLAFEPVKGRHLSDIKGTLWIDAATAMLRRLEFQYVNRPDRADVGRAGGEVQFGRLPNGTWVVKDWHVRMPVLATNISHSRYFVRGYEEQGGGVWRVIDAKGATVVEAESSTLSGFVVDSIGTLGLSGARLEVVDAGGGSVTSGEDGSFMLPGLPSGPLSVLVYHPSLDSLALGPVHFVVDAAAGEVSTVRLRLPGVAELLRSACVEAPPTDQPVAMVLGRVRSGDAPADSAQVRIQWLGNRQSSFEASSSAAPPTGGDEGPQWRVEEEKGVAYLRTTLDSRGIFLVCGVPRNTQIRVEASLHGQEPVVRTVTITRSDVVVITSLSIPQAGTH